MSRIGRMPITIPDEVSIELTSNKLRAKGPKGQLSLDIHPKINVVQKDKQMIVEKKTNDKLCRSLYGLTQRLIQNIITGVYKGFEKKLEIKGVGYRAEASDGNLILNVGYSHQINLEIPDEIEVKVQKNIVTVSGIDKQKVGQFAAQIREVRKPEPYKGKGIRYVDEVIRRKVGKAAKTAVAGA